MRLRNQTWRCVLFLLTLVMKTCLSEDDEQQRDPTFNAVVHLTYTDPVTLKQIYDSREMGIFGKNSLKTSVTGLVVHVRDSNNNPKGCSVPVNQVPPKTKWIALVQRGDCNFHDKIHNAAVVRNASAVVVYDNKPNAEIAEMEYNVQDVVTIMISKKDGEKIVLLVDNGTNVTMNISYGSMTPPSVHEQFNKTSVLFVSISFIVLMVISLAWLIFYYVQRFRYVHAKERLSRRLAGAAKKAISKIPLRTIKSGDKETMADAQQCAVCIESFCTSEVVRELPCKHLFHKSCVDPWLLDQRSCPMCKMDILKAYGLHVPGVPTKGSVEDTIEITSTQSPDEDSMEPIRSIHMVHVESGVLFHQCIDEGLDNSDTQGETSRKRNPSGDSVASHVSLKSSESCTEFQSLIHVKPHVERAAATSNSSGEMSSGNTEV